MARIIFRPDNLGEARAYVMALTGAKNVVIPPAPPPEQLGQVVVVASKYVSVSASADLGFGWAQSSVSGNTKVLLQDYWFLKEILGDIPEVNSWTFAAGFRVGLKISGFSASLDIGLGALAAKAQTQGLNVQIQVILAGMPAGPAVPAGLAVPTTLDVDKFGDLRAWEESVLKYVSDNKPQIAPLLVSASVNINGEKLLNEFPAGRYSLWRIAEGETLLQAMSHVTAGKTPGITTDEVRSVYAAVFNDPSMLVPDQPSEKRKPGVTEIAEARDWLTGYKDIPTALTA